MLDCTFYELMAFPRGELLAPASLPRRARLGHLREGWQLGATQRGSPALSPSLRWGPHRRVWFAAVQRCQDPTELHRGRMKRGPRGSTLVPRSSW